jgi:RimJ/RimL family protein N-acetyltransferase
MENLFLKGEKVYLRPLELKDLEGGYKNWLNDPEVCQFNGHNRFPYHPDQLKSYITSSFQEKSLIVLAICLQEDNRHVGNISLQNISFVDRNAEFAILIGDTNLQGKGVGKDAGKLIIKHGFNALNLHRIYCGTSERNIGMQKLANFLGMSEEGRRKDAIFKDGQYLDILEYGIVRQK